MEFAGTGSAAASVFRTTGSAAAIGMLVATDAAAPAGGGIGVTCRNQPNRAGKNPAEQTAPRAVDGKRPRETIESRSVHCGPFPRNAMFSN
jgi:hypothetical protein